MSEMEEWTETTDTICEIRTFVITGVIDPRNQQTVSVYQAFSYGILDQVKGLYCNPDTLESTSIPEAINLGYIMVEYQTDMVNGVNGVMSMKNMLDTRTYGIQGVIDPRTGEWISVEEAIAAGILDLERGMFINPVTGEEMTILDAIKNGFIIADPELLAALENQEPGLYTFVDWNDLAYYITSVVDPVTGDDISLKRAIIDGVVDPKKGTYFNSLTGETMSIMEAIKRGLIKGRVFDPTKDPDDGNVLRFRQLQVKQQMFHAAEAELFGESVDSLEGMPKAHTANEIMFEKLKGTIDVSMRGIVEESSQKRLSIEEAFKAGILRLGSAEFESTSEITSIEEATAKGLIEPKVLREILKAYDECSVGELVDKGVFDSETGLVTDLKTGHSLSLQTAISQHLVNPETIFFYDNPSHRIMSLASAIETGRYDLETGKYVNSATEEDLTMNEAVNANLICTHVDPASIAEHAETLGYLRSLMDTNLKGVHTPHTADALSIEEAVMSGVINLPQAEYIGENVHDPVPLAAAVKSEKINTEVATQLFGAMNKLSLHEAIQTNTINPQTGKFYKAATNETMSLYAAEGKGEINPNFVFFVDKKTDDIASLGAFMSKGKFDAKTGKFKDTKTGIGISIAKAIEQGMIDPVINPDKFVQITSTLKDLIDSGKVNPRTTSFIAPNGQEMSLRDALANGFLTMNSKVKHDPQSGTVRLASDEDVVKALVNVKESTDWLSAVEQTLASQRKPSEQLEKLEVQKEETHVSQLAQIMKC